MSNPQSELSERETAIKSRERGEAGWDYGWNPFNYDDQVAHLGELAIALTCAEHDPKQLQASMGVPGDPDPKQASGEWWIDELRRRILRDAIELRFLSSLPYGSLTREDLKAAEAAWYQSGLTVK